MRTRLSRKHRVRGRWAAIAVGAIASTAAGARGILDGHDGDELNTALSDDPVLLPNTLNRGADDRYAAHRSHSSHGSHRSHRSSGGTRSQPAPSVQPRAPQTTPSPTPAPAQPAPRKSPGTGQVLPKPTQQELSLMVVRVQAALMRLGYYDGDIDGLLGPATRAGLKNFQKSQGLRQTGRIDLETLTRLGIPVP